MQNVRPNLEAIRRKFRVDNDNLYLITLLYPRSVKMFDLWMHRRMDNNIRIEDLPVPSSPHDMHLEPRVAIRIAPMTTLHKPIVVIVVNNNIYSQSLNEIKTK
jgi:hypothetical protein